MEAVEVILNKTPKHLEKGLDLAGKALTPLSERPRASYGSFEMSLQNSEGLCTVHRKCVLHDGHAVPCWPGD